MGPDPFEYAIENRAHALLGHNVGRDNREVDRLHQQGDNAIADSITTRAPGTRGKNLSTPNNDARATTPIATVGQSQSPIWSSIEPRATRRLSTSRSSTAG
jgi:hypothetical protein